MRRFSANLGLMFHDLPLLDRIAAAAKTGFAAVEIQGTEGASPADIRSAAADAGVEIILCNAPVGDLLTGGPGLSGVPGRQAQFQAAVREAAAVAEAIGCGSINLGPSRVEDAATRNESLAVLVGNLRYAGEFLGQRGIRALTEPLNGNDFPGVLLSDAHVASQIIRACGHTNVFLQFDIYHMHQMHADALATLEECFALVGHVQFADVPGRGPPGTGQIDFHAFFVALDRLGYNGWIGAEYRCAAPGGHDWLDRHSGRKPISAA